MSLIPKVVIIWGLRYYIERAICRVPIEDNDNKVCLLGLTYNRIVIIVIKHPLPIT